MPAESFWSVTSQLASQEATWPRLPSLVSSRDATVDLKARFENAACVYGGLWEVGELGSADTSGLAATFSLLLSQTFVRLLEVQ